MTREELPYLLDLHLFLSRPLQPAPVVPLSQARLAADSLDAASSLYGSFPQVPHELLLSDAVDLCPACQCHSQCQHQGTDADAAVPCLPIRACTPQAQLDMWQAPTKDPSNTGSCVQVVVADAAARTRTLLEQSETMASLQRSATAAFGLYRRTRPAASPQSAVRAKALPAEGVHPLLAAHVPANALAGLEDQVTAASRGAGCGVLAGRASASLDGCSAACVCPGWAGGGCGIQGTWSLPAEQVRPRMAAHVLAHALAALEGTRCWRQGAGFMM